jgi:hypothetical protein
MVKNVDFVEAFKKLEDMANEFGAYLYKLHEELVAEEPNCGQRIQSAIDAAYLLARQARLIASASGQGADLAKVFEKELQERAKEVLGK